MPAAGASRPATVVVVGVGVAGLQAIATAKRLGAKYTIARVRNVEYAMELSLLKEALGIDLVINPENATAVEISSGNFQPSMRWMHFTP